MLFLICSPIDRPYFLSSSTLDDPKVIPKYTNNTFFVFFLISGIPGHHDNPLGYVCMSGHVMLFHTTWSLGSFFANTEYNKNIYERSTKVVVLNKDAVNTCYPTLYSR